MIIKSKQESILDTATSLFSQFGYNEVGIDRIIAESNIAKMTLYKYFPSKEILIEKVLLRRDNELRISILDCVNKNKLPLKKLKAIFDWYEEWFKSPQFHGCMFIKASEEFFDKSSNIRQISQNHKVWLTELISSILHENGTASPDKLALYLMVILDGLTVTSNMFESSSINQTNIVWNYVKHLI